MVRLRASKYGTEWSFWPTYNGQEPLPNKKCLKIKVLFGTLISKCVYTRPFLHPFLFFILLCLYQGSFLLLACFTKNVKIDVITRKQTIINESAKGYLMNKQRFLSPESCFFFYFDSTSGLIYAMLFFNETRNYFTFLFFFLFFSFTFTLLYINVLNL